MFDPSALPRELNAPQLQAATHVHGPLLVFAGAGSGKTRVITYRIANLLTAHGVPAYRVLAVTFTNKAAGEMRRRLAALVGERAAKDLWVATFHATGAKLLRMYGDRVGLKRDFAIYDDGDQRALMSRIYDDLRIDDKALPVRQTLGEIDRAKQEVKDPSDLLAAAQGQVAQQIARAWAEYEKRKSANNAVDFGDLISMVARLVERDDEVRTELQERLHYLMVDEFQDTNNAQYRILRALEGERKNLCVVGDDDQAIYAWRGADVRNIRYFKRDHPEARVVKLEQNYRSTGRILRAANAVISKAVEREGKTLFTNNPDGPLIELLPCDDEREEARAIAQRVKGALERGTPAREVAVFYRIHAQSRTLEEAMRVANVPYVIVGGVRFYERAEVKDLIAYLRLTLNPHDDVSLMRVVNVPPRKIGKTTLDRMLAHAYARQCSMWKLIATGDLPSEVGPAARKALAGFYQLISILRAEGANEDALPAETARNVYERTGYRAMLEAKDDPENESRRENVMELIGSMQDYEEEVDEPTVSEWLERVSLSEIEAQGDGEVERVSLMTVHSAKGLEFQSVYIAALEDGMFPYKGIELGSDPDELEEERRLAYVAITRARQSLCLSYCRFRQIFGQTKILQPSRFLFEIPAEVLSKPLRRFGIGDSSGFERRATSPGFGARAPIPAVSPRSIAQRAQAIVHRDLTLREAAEDESPSLPEHPPGELVFVPDDAPQAHSFRRGMRVKHPKFGPGTVRGVHPGPELKLEVYFPGVGAAKVLLAQYVKPL
ncbi:MAG: UvrD-helicase domain-containing protein [Polyangiales bacterium]